MKMKLRSIIPAVLLVAVSVSCGRSYRLDFVPDKYGSLVIPDRYFDAYAEDIVCSDSTRAAGLIGRGYAIADSLSLDDPSTDALYNFAEGMALRLGAPSSRWMDAERMTMALDREARCMALEPADFRKISYKREMLALNAPGRLVSDFTAISAEGDSVSFRSLFDRRTLLFIFGESCSSCRKLQDELSGMRDIPGIRRIALYTGTSDEEFNLARKKLPGWEFFRDNAAVTYGGAFDLRYIPSLYVVSEYGIVSRRGARHLKDVKPDLLKDRTGSLTIRLKEGEYVWGGRVSDGRNMPFADGFSATLRENGGNQVTPLLMTSAGRYVWSGAPFDFSVRDGSLVIENASRDIETAIVGKTLADAYHFAMRAFFPPQGGLPPEEFFTRPQYNTWIELQYNQNQEGVLRYAEGILRNGLPPGIIMIDDTWMEDYGKWVFHPGRFPDPKAMCDKLHRMGFKVMLWVVPFVSMDQYQIWARVNSFDGFIKKEDGSVYPVAWWNGVSAELDLSNPDAFAWLDDCLGHLVQEYGVDGFKFDAGDFTMFPSDGVTRGGAAPYELCSLFASFSEKYPYNEFRTSWNYGGRPVIQRLHDKSHTWDALGVLLPEMMAANMLGYWFSCPDMIGGGSFASFLPGCTINQDLIVRSAQTHALMPMMQFSAAPWRILDKEHLQAVLDAVSLRKSLLPEIVKYTRRAAETGEPIVSPMEYCWPQEGYARVKDQFVLGGEIIVAPMLEEGTERTVLLPGGSWKADDGTVYQGPSEISIHVPLSRLPWFRKI